MSRRLVEHAREVVRFAPVRPAVMAGLRAAIATVLPVVAAMALHLPSGVWPSLGGFNVSFADKGGSYRARATSMGAGLLVGALAVILGALAAEHPVLSILMALLWVTTCSFAGVYGVAANVVGNTASSAFVVSLAFPAADLGEVLARGGWLGMGGAGAMFLSLVLWPIRPHGPSRVAVAECFRALASYAGEVHRMGEGDAEGGPWQQTLLQRHHGHIRETLEVAGSTLTASRRGRGESQRGDQLLVLLQIADAMFATFIALADVLEGLPREQRDTPVWRRVERAVEVFRGALLALAGAVEREGGGRAPPALDWGLEGLELPESPDEGERARRRYALGLLAQLREFTASASRMETRLTDPTALTRVDPRPWTQRVFGPVRANLSLDSMVLRHALRVGLTTTVGVCASLAFVPSHGYWVTITVLTIMQPYTGATVLKGLQRVGGTVVGGMLAAAITTTVQHPLALLPLVFLTVAISIAVIPLNYGLYTTFLTLTFVLLAELGTGDWGLARLRILNTLLGGALALAGTWLLWERSEHVLLPEQISSALRANREHFRQVLAERASTERRAQEGFSEARRQMGLATLNAEASFQRLLSEPRRRTEPLEPLMTLLVYLRRFAASVVALSATPAEAAPERRRAELARFADTVGGVLEDLAEAVTRGRAPSPLPDLEAWLEQAPVRASGETAEPEPLLRLQLERVTRRLIVLHGAVSRRGANTPLERGGAA